MRTNAMRSKLVLPSAAAFTSASATVSLSTQKTNDLWNPVVHILKFFSHNIPSKVRVKKVFWGLVDGVDTTGSIGQLFLFCVCGLRKK